MAAIEMLDDLPMTVVETLLKQCMEERPDIAGRILSAEELSAYIAWMVERYGKTYGKATRDMIPFFTPNNEMTRIAGEIAEHPEDPRSLRRLTGELTVQNDEGFIAPGMDVSVGRMLRYNPGNWHTSTYFTVYYAFSGECPVHFTDEEVRVKRGTVLVVSPGVLHATPCYSDDAVLAFYMMRSSIFKSVFWNQLGDENLLTKFFRLALENEQATSYIRFETGEDPEISRLLLQIYREHQEDGMYAAQMINSLMRLFFLLILRRYEGTARLPRTEYFFWKHQYSAVLSYIQSDFAHATLESVAEKFSYSAKQVGRIVKDCTGESFGNLVRSLKMRRAAELLRDRKMTPEETAEAVGYATVNSFYRSFTDWYGVPPREWTELQS